MSRQLPNFGNIFPGQGPGGPGGPGFPPGGPGFPPGGPGFPPGGPGMGPGPGGPGGAQAGSPPQSPPPTFTPQKPLAAGPGVFAVDPGAIAGCRFRYVYIWQTNGQSYWAYLTFVGRHSIAGFKWVGFGPFGFWQYFGLDLRFIDQFTCF